MARVVVGLQPVREAIRAHGAQIEVVTVDRAGGPRLDALARFARDAGARVERTDRADLDRRAGGVSHQGAIAVAPDLLLCSVADLRIDPRALFLALDGVQDPQNFGAAIRSAVGLGARAVVWPEHASAPLGPATFRASAGAVEHAVLCRAPSLPSALGDLRDRGCAIVGLDAGARVDLRAVDLRGPVVVVVGSEGEGLHRAVRAACTHRARLPMRGPVESLNASVAAAIALYEAARQREAP